VAVDVPVVVIEAGHVVPVATMRARSALSSWERTVGMRAVAPAEEKRPALDTVKAEELDRDGRTRRDRVMQIERVLHLARGKLDLGDAAVVGDVRAMLAEVYALERANVADPEAPTLVAEVLRAQARCELLAGDTAAATALRTRADLLDGGRLIGISEGAAPIATASPRVRVELVAPAAGEGELHVVIDGDDRVVAGSSRLPWELVPGEHHVRATIRSAEGESLLDARWFDVAASGAEIHLRSARIAAENPCSREKLERAALASAAAPGCALWARVAPMRSDVVEVSLCSAAGCAEPTRWAAPSLMPVAPAVKPSSSVGSWTWIALAGAAVVGGSVAAWRLGAFDRPAAPPPTWHWEGAK